MKLLLSVVILHHNDFRNLHGTFYSILNQKFDLTQVEIIIVDNGSNKMNLDKVKKIIFDNKNIVNSAKLISLDSNLGVAVGFNEGFKLAHGDYVLKCDADIELPENFLKDLFTIVKCERQIGVLGAVMYSFQDKNKLHTAGTNFINPFFAEKSVSCKQGVFEVDLIPGPVMLIKKVVIDKIGGFDSKFFIYYDDYDFCYRVKKAGYKVATYGDLRFYHKGAFTTLRNLSPARLKMMTQNRIIFIKKHVQGIHLIGPFLYLALATFKKISILFFCFKFKKVISIILGTIKGWKSPVY